MTYFEELARLLRGAWLRPTSWPAYVEWVFEWFIGWKDTHPPPAVVCSDRQVESYLSKLGPRKLDHVKAAQMLRGAGFNEGRIWLLSASNAVEEAMHTGGLPRHMHPERYREAVEWLWGRRADVGFADPEGG